MSIPLSTAMSTNSNQLLLHQMRSVLMPLLIIHIAYHLEYQKNCQSCFVSKRLTRSGLITRFPKLISICHLKEDLYFTSC